MNQFLPPSDATKKMEERGLKKTVVHVPYVFKYQNHSENRNGKKIYIIFPKQCENTSPNKVGRHKGKELYGFYTEVA